MKKILFVGFIIILLVISTVYAFENYFVGEEINIVIPLFNDTGTELLPIEDQVCNGSIYFYENASWIIQDIPLMNHTGGLHNFTFIPIHIGEYGVFVECWVNGNLTTFQRKIEVLNTTLGGGNETLENLIYNETLYIVEEEKMIGTSMIFGILVAIALLFLVIAIFGIGEEHYFDVLSAFISPTILMLLGYQCYVSNALQEFEFLGLLLVVVAVIIYIYGVVLIIDVAVNQFNYGEDETTRDADYEYK